jgi:hypothetical protein
VRSSSLFIHPPLPLRRPKEQENDNVSGDKGEEKNHVAMSCCLRSLECIGPVCLPKLHLRVHRMSSLAAEYATLEALQLLEPHSDPRRDSAQSRHL